MDLGQRHRERQLVLQPYASPHQVTLTAHVELEKARFYYAVDDLHRKPKGPPECRLDLQQVKGSRKVIVVGGLAYTIVQALAKNEMVGQSATDAMHALFWRYFVEDNAGLLYLYRYGTKSIGDFYTRVRIQALADHDDSDPAVKAIFQALSSKADGEGVTVLDAFYGCLRVQDDADFRDAIRAIIAMHEPEETQHRRVLAFLHVHIAEVSKRRRIELGHNADED